MQERTAFGFTNSEIEMIDSHVFDGLHEGMMENKYLQFMLRDGSMRITSAI
jgi:hypothetical protein